MSNFGIDMTAPAGWLPLVFALVMALAILAYVVLDGYDLGVLLGALYLPVALMLMALTVRGVAFDFRVKSQPHLRPLWDRAFYAGSLLASWSQGFMLGALITGFKNDTNSYLFSALIGLCLISAYRLLGATWLIMKTEHALQLKAVAWAKASLWMTALGVLAISVATPWVSSLIFDKWFSFPNILMLFPIPAATVVLLGVIYRSLVRLPVRLEQRSQYGSAVPFACTVGVFLLAFYGLAYSLFPWLVIDQINIWQAASSAEALLVIFYGTVLVLPVIIGYTIYSYRVFWGKSIALSY
jgi:cytochrome d ubiquinol oxidase subunit II